MQAISDGNAVDRSLEDPLSARAPFPLIFNLRLDPDFRNLEVIFVTCDSIDESCLRAISEEKVRAEAEGKDIIVIVTYSGNDPAQEILALEAGADYCYCAPYDYRYTFLHLQSILARYRHKGRSGEPHLVDVDPGTHQALVKGHPVHVSNFEFRLLLELRRERGSVVSHRHLESVLWGYPGASSHVALKQLVHRLRVRLGPAADAIITVPSVGYILT